MMNILQALFAWRDAQAHMDFASFVSWQVKRMLFTSGFYSLIAVPIMLFAWCAGFVVRLIQKEIEGFRVLPD